MGGAADTDSSEVTIPRICNVNSAFRARRNKLDSSSSCHGVAFVPDDVRVFPTRIGKSHALGVNMWFAVGIVAFIVSHGSCRDDDQATPRVRVPAGTSARCP